MTTFKLVMSYDGTKYAGWQVQKNALTIQELLERAVHKITNQQVRVIASGRTDAGVHAYAQVASFQIETRLNASQMLRAINGNLPFDIRINHAETVADDFDPIRHATRKSYRYVIQDGRVHDVFQQGFCWFVPGELNVSAMQLAANVLTGEHDFASFQSAGSDRATTVRNVDTLSVVRRDTSRFIDIDISSNGFLYNMVRNIVGTLVEVGKQTHPAEWVESVLAAKDRQAAGMTSPALGLFLVSVEYPSL